MTENSRMLDIFERMLKIRRFEEKVLALHDAGDFSGHYHLYIGQEATGAPVVAALEDKDQIFTTHRNHGHLIGRGADPGAAMAEILGRATGLNGGRGGTFHLSDPALGAPHTSALVGGCVPLAAGAAFGAKVAKSGAVGVALFGDGCFEEGVVFETLNLALLWKLPVIFVCENNTPGAILKSDGGNNTSNLPEGRVAATPRGLGMETHEVDGGDAVAVDALFRDCLTRCRETGEPVFIEALTERWPGNYFSFPSLVTGETNLAMAWDFTLITGEHAEWIQDHDPLLRLCRTLLADGVVRASDVSAMDDKISEIMVTASEFALSSPWPDVATAGDYLFAGEAAQ
jgi:TPP-dependent pyruvate/acetoin dehydrogenase alpha subunit